MKYFSEKPFKNSAFAVPTMADISKKQKNRFFASLRIPLRRLPILND